MKKGTVVTGVGTVNVRDASGQVVVGLLAGDSVYGTLSTSGRTRIYFQRIHRYVGRIDDLGELCSAAVDDSGTPPVVWIEITDVDSEPGTVTPPIPPPASGDITVTHNDTITLPDGTVYKGSGIVSLTKQ